MSYRETREGRVLIRLEDGAFIPKDPANRAYQRYLAWVALGNTAEPAGWLDLAEAKADLRGKIKDRRRRAEAAGITAGARRIPTTPEFRAQLRDLKVWSDDNPTLDIPVELEDGRVVKVTRAQFLAAVQLIMARVRDCMEVEFSKLEALETVPDLATAVTFEQGLETGWPA